MHGEAHTSGTGIVHWNPPQQAMDAVIASAGDHSLNQYGSGAGLPDLVKALKQKLAAENGITQVTLRCKLLWRCKSRHKHAVNRDHQTI